MSDATRCIFITSAEWGSLRCSQQNPQFNQVDALVERPCNSTVSVTCSTAALTVDMHESRRSFSRKDQIATLRETIEYRVTVLAACDRARFPTGPEIFSTNAVRDDLTRNLGPDSINTERR
ncbi:hypothetical protein An18g01270 [Aspergillus niger]|uniref:Uncharacterized protein n=2 Tax=Aspergillus niger TaxID=5061 RepID=E2PT29_ASPNC|nr:hypothetical protein An18g01270 [Aspergillus niger]CAK47201.1 hypothetical protein An18g01270 [Aspergillus niger]